MITSASSSLCLRSLLVTFYSFCSLRRASYAWLQVSKWSILRLSSYSRLLIASKLSLSCLEKPLGIPTYELVDYRGESCAILFFEFSMLLRKAWFMVYNSLLFSSISSTCSSNSLFFCSTYWSNSCSRFHSSCIYDTYLFASCCSSVI